LSSDKTPTKVGYGALTRAGRVIDGDTCDTEEQARAQAVKSLALRNKAAFSDLT